MINTTALKPVYAENSNFKIVDPHNEKQIWNITTWSRKVLPENTDLSQEAAS